MTCSQRFLCLSLAALVGCGGDVTLPTPSGEGVTLSIEDGIDRFVSWYTSYYGNGGPS